MAGLLKILVAKIIFLYGSVIFLSASLLFFVIQGLIVQWQGNHEIAVLFYFAAGTSALGAYYSYYVAKKNSLIAEFSELRKWA